MEMHMTFRATLFSMQCDCNMHVIDVLYIIIIIICLFLADALHPSQQIFRQVKKFPWLNQY